MKAIYFDMDGTIYNLYGVENWLTLLKNEKEEAYSIGEPLYDMKKLNALLEEFQERKISVGVITWSAKRGSKEFNTRTRKVKRQWIKENLPCVREFHCVKYGTPKHKVRKIKDSILIDDNKEVRELWKGETIDANKDIIEELEKLLKKIDI